MMLTNCIIVACIGIVSATYYASPPPYYLNRLEGAGLYGGGLAGPAGVHFGYNGAVQRVPVPVAYPSPALAPVPSPALNQQALSQMIAYLNTQSQLSDPTVSASEPLVIYENKNSEVAQGRRPSNVRGNIVAHPLNKFRSKNPGAKVTGVLPGNLGYVLSVPKKKISNGAEKQAVVIQNSPNGPAVSVALGGQSQPNLNFPGLQALLSMMRPGGNGFFVFLPPNQLNQFQSQTQTPTLSSQSQTQGQGSKQPTEQYQPTFVPPGIDSSSGDGYQLELTPGEESQISEEQLSNSDDIQTSLEEDPEANNGIIPVSVGEGPDSVLEVDSKRINKYGYQRRPGGLYLIPNKIRYSKGLAQDDSSSTKTEPNSNSEETQ